MGRHASHADATAISLGPPNMTNLLIDSFTGAVRVREVSYHVPTHIKTLLYEY